MRPSSELLDVFSNLSELDETIRRQALKSITSYNSELSSEEINKYTLERLISGLASSRAASRIGFSSALTLLLSTEYATTWNWEKLFGIAKKKIDLADKTVGSAHYIAHYLLLTAYIHSGKYKENEIGKIVEHIKNLKDGSSSLAYALFTLLADFCVSMDEKCFTANALQPITPILESINVAFTPENVAFILTLRKKYASIVLNYAKFIKKDGTCHFQDDSYHKLLLALKKCNASNVQVFLNILLDIAEESGNFEKLYIAVIEPWALASQETKVLDRIFGVVRKYFDRPNIDPKLLVVVFTKELINRMEMAIRGKGHFRLLRTLVNEFGNYVKAKFETIKGDAALATLKDLQKCGTVDRASGTALTTTLLANLEKKQVSTWIKENIENHDEVRKIISAFSSWDEKSRVTVLSALLKQKASETTQMVVTSIIDSLFYVKTRAGEFASIQLSDHNENILHELVVAIEGEEGVKKAEKTFKKANIRQKSLHILWLVTRIWSAVAPNPEDAASYDSDSEELLEISKNENDKNNSQVFVDLLIGILSREKKFHRTPVAFAFAHAIKSLKSKDLIHIVETAMMDEKELIDNEEEIEDEEGMPFEAEVSKKADDEDVSDDDDDDDDEEDDDDELNESVDQELLNKLNEALGDAAAKGDVSDEEMDDLDDETMLKMDERLAAAFKAMAPKSVTRAKQNTRNVEALKMKVADILLIAISSKELKEKNKIKLIVPLLKWAKIDLKMHNKVAQRAIELIGVIVHMKMTEVSEKECLELIKEVIEESQNATNPLIVECIAIIIGFLLRTSSSDGQHISEGVKAEFLKLFQNFFENVEGKVPADFVIKPIIENPKLFVDQIQMLLDAGFNEENRIFKRTEVLNALAIICTKNVLQDSNIDKTFVKSIGKKSSAYFESVLNDESADIKPRFFATILRVVSNISSAVKEDEKRAKILRENLGETITKMSNGEGAAKLKKLNSICQQIVGRSAQKTILLIVKDLEISE